MGCWSPGAQSTLCPEFKTVREQGAEPISLRFRRASECQKMESTSSCSEIFQEFKI